MSEQPEPEAFDTPEVAAWFEARPDPDAIAEERRGWPFSGIG